MPVKDGKVVTETTNERQENIDFHGKLVYTMENVFGSAESQDEQTNANQGCGSRRRPGGYKSECGSRTRHGGQPIQRKIRRRQKMRQTAAENAASEETAGDGTEGTKAPETDET